MPQLNERVLRITVVENCSRLKNTSGLCQWSERALTVSCQCPASGYATAAQLLPRYRNGINAKSTLTPAATDSLLSKSNPDSWQ